MPAMTNLTLPEEGVDVDTLFPADEAAEPIVAWLKVSLAGSKSISKLILDTAGIGVVLNDTGIETLVSP